MTERPPTPDQDDPPADDGPPSPGALSDDQVAGIQRSFLRLTFWQTLLSLAGVFTGAVALYAALTESQAVRQQTAASVWPYVQFMINDSDDGESASFALSLDNVGVGPALVQGLHVAVAGTAVTNWEGLTRALLDRDVRLGVDYGKSSVGRRVLAPGESVVAFQTEDRDLAIAMQNAVYSGAVQLSYCFCSIFQECWVVDSARERVEEPVERVERCPDHGTAAFHD